MLGFRFFRVNEALKLCICFSVLQKCLCGCSGANNLLQYSILLMVFIFLVPNSIYYNLLYYRSIDNSVIKKKKKFLKIPTRNVNIYVTPIFDIINFFFFLLNCIKYFKIFRLIFDYILILYTMNTMNLFTPFYGMLTST